MAIMSGVIQSFFPSVRVGAMKSRTIVFSPSLKTFESAEMSNETVRLPLTEECDGIRPNDVIAHVGVSRSLLNLRFRQVCGKSINEDILDVRLAEVRRQLEKTGHTILQIGRDCGFNDPDHLKRIFKKRFGTSMRLYRNTYRSSDVQTTLPVCVTGAARP